MTAKQRSGKRRKQAEDSSIKVPPQLRWAEAPDRRAKEVIESILLQAYDNGTWQITYRIVEPSIETYGVKRAERQ